MKDHITRNIPCWKAWKHGVNQYLQILKVVAQMYQLTFQKSVKIVLPTGPCDILPSLSIYLLSCCY
jgi:hypothetical protein